MHFGKNCKPGIEAWKTEKICIIKREYSIVDVAILVAAIDITVLRQEKRINNRRLGFFLAGSDINRTLSGRSFFVVG